MDLIERLSKNSENKPILFAAIEQLKDEREIREFFPQYIKNLQDSRKKLVQETPSLTYLLYRNIERDAARNVVYALEGYGKEFSRRWVDTLPQINFHR